MLEMPPRSKMVGEGLSCMSFCQSVILSDNLNFITYQHWVLGLWYFTWVFLVTRQFHGYNIWFFTLWPWLMSLKYFFENLNLVADFWAFYFLWKNFTLNKQDSDKKKKVVSDRPLTLKKNHIEVQSVFFHVY